jgi:hypothetical protein
MNALQSINPRDGDRTRPHVHWNSDAPRTVSTPHCAMRKGSAKTDVCCVTCLALTKCVQGQAAVRKEVASAIIKAVVGVKSAEVTPDKVVVRFGEAVDGFPLPAGHTHANVDEPPKDK